MAHQALQLHGALEVAEMSEDSPLGNALKRVLGTNTHAWFAWDSVANAQEIHSTFVLSRHSGTRYGLPPGAARRLERAFAGIAADRAEPQPSAPLPHERNTQTGVKPRGPFGVTLRLPRIAGGWCPACRAEHAAGEGAPGVTVSAMENEWEEEAISQLSTAMSMANARSRQRKEPVAVTVSRTYQVWVACDARPGVPWAYVCDDCLLLADPDERPERVEAHPWAALSTMEPMPGVLAHVEDPDPQCGWTPERLLRLALYSAVRPEWLSATLDESVDMLHAGPQRMLQRFANELLFRWNDGHQIVGRRIEAATAAAGGWRQAWDTHKEPVVRAKLGNLLAGVLLGEDRPGKTGGIWHPRATKTRMVVRAADLPRGDFELNTLNPPAVTERMAREAVPDLGEALDALRELRWHVYHRLCRDDPERCIYLWKCMAHLVQRYAHRLMMCITLFGEEGTGKGTLVQLLISVLGQANCYTESQADAISQRFNAHLAGKALYFLDEAWSGNPRGASAFKASVTEAELSVEDKGVRKTMVENVGTLIVSSNSRQCVHAGAGSRRVFLLRVSGELATGPGDSDETRARKREIARRCGGADETDPDRQRLVLCLARVLYAVDLAGFEPTQRPAGALDEATDQVVIQQEPPVAFLVQALRDHFVDGDGADELPWDAPRRFEEFQRTGGSAAAHFSATRFAVELRDLLVPHPQAATAYAQQTLAAVAARLGLSEGAVLLGAADGQARCSSAGAGVQLREGDKVLPSVEAPTELSAPLLARTCAPEGPSLADWAAAALEAAGADGLSAKELHAALPPALAALFQTPTAVSRQLLRSAGRIRRVHLRHGNVYTLAQPPPPARGV